ncbi:MAG TPA: exo-alpha-sialidase [Prolixibacteraceae bacterium]|nr:exo-alpha-sialidase [Prolixibacteraceae bacterium]
MDLNEIDLELSMQLPKINTQPLPFYGYDRLDYAMNRGIEITPGGRLWAVWVGGGDNETAFSILAYSDQGGEAWSDPCLVIDLHDDKLPCPRHSRVCNLWTDPLGRLWLFFEQSLGNYDGRAGNWAICCCNPDSSNRIWSTPRRIWHGMTLNKALALSTGEWLLPISLWPRHLISMQFAECYRELDGFRMANVFASKDQGETWERRSGVLYPKSNFDEHTIIERKDGSLWMLARTEMGIFESRSTDRGIHWSEPCKYMEHISSRFHIRRLRSGRLLLIKHGLHIGEKTERRSHLCAFLSDDEGSNWTSGLILDEREGVSYPDGAQGSDGTIYISYDRNRATDAEILMAKFSEEDILEGRLMCKKSRLRMLVTGIKK